MGMPSPGKVKHKKVTMENIFSEDIKILKETSNNMNKIMDIIQSAETIKVRVQLP